MGDTVIAFVFAEPDNPKDYAEIIDRAKKVASDVPNVRVKLAIGDAAETIKFFLETGELPADEKMPGGDDEESNLVQHARRELALAGNDTDFNACIINAVRSFAAYGHSGGSAGVGIHILHDLLQFNNLTPLTDDPSEWMKISGDGDWQSNRNPEAFSKDRGKTYYLLSEGGHTDNPEPVHETVRKP